MELASFRIIEQVFRQKVKPLLVSTATNYGKEHKANSASVSISNLCRRATRIELAVHRTATFTLSNET